MSFSESLPDGNFRIHPGQAPLKHCLYYRKGSCRGIELTRPLRIQMQTAHQERTQAKAHPEHRHRKEQILARGRKSANHRAPRQACNKVGGGQRFRSLASRDLHHIIFRIVPSKNRWRHCGKATWKSELISYNQRAKKKLPNDAKITS